jgi:hypothetical protein
MVFGAKIPKKGIFLLLSQKNKKRLANNSFFSIFAE